MSAARIHVLEHALHLHYGAAPGDDLSYRVLMRWKAGETGEALPVTRRVTAPLWLAAAGVALLAGLGMWLGKPSQPAVLVALEQPVRVLRESSWSPTEAHEIRVGDTVLLGEESLQLELGRTRLDLQPETLATFHPTEIHLLLGALQVTHMGGQPFEITSSLVAVRVTDPARLAIQITPREIGANLMFPTLARQVFLSTAPVALVLSVAMTEGTATVESNGLTIDLPAYEVLERAWIEEQDPYGKKQVTPAPVVDPAADNPALAFLMREVGTWDAVATALYPDAAEPMTMRGVEVSVMGPGGAWLVSDLTITMAGMENSLHWVVGINEEDPNKYIGTSVESYGGLRILEGTFDENKRIMYARLPSETEVMDTLRMVYTWISYDERLVVSEQKEGDEWVKAMEIRYTRRKDG